MRRPWPTGGGAVVPKTNKHTYMHTYIHTYIQTYIHIIFKEPITFLNSTTVVFVTFRPPISCRFTTGPLPAFRMKIPPAKISPDTLSPSERPTFTPPFLYESTLTCGPVGIATSYGKDGPWFESCAASDVGLSAESLELPRQLFSYDCLKGWSLVVAKSWDMGSPSIREWQKKIVFLRIAEKILA